MLKKFAQFRAIRVAYGETVRRCGRRARFFQRLVSSAKASAEQWVESSRRCACDRLFFHASLTVACFQRINTLSSMRERSLYRQRAVRRRWSHASRPLVPTEKKFAKGC